MLPVFDNHFRVGQGQQETSRSLLVKALTSEDLVRLRLHLFIDRVEIEVLLIDMLIHDSVFLFHGLGLCYLL